MMVGYLSILEDIWHPVIESTRGGVHLGCMANCDIVWVRGGGQSPCCKQIGNGDKNDDRKMIYVSLYFILTSIVYDKLDSS